MGMSNLIGSPRKLLLVWKLKEKREEYNREVNELRKRLADRENTSCEEHWNQMSEILEEAAKKCCGQTRGDRSRDNEAWWLNPEVQEKLKEKKTAYKNLKQGTGNLDDYKKLKKSQESTCNCKGRCLERLVRQSGYQRR
ncbi:uncharacterized protein LOC134779899 [Penaeus indicus]|uniref:uncharacterized protein LOC134779899 n=1 Tax=Penaeus indicus TaxID=29960 RepID=UPI00300C45E6